ncbi:MAG TPA: single-stranded-DNA-specific exonuclease RecJ [Candidatus Limnocylindria bacterium]|nr:single-stranded-DNA-specific exonuclease RecJ [Candidatus Limnocylindria bacterium]
MEGPLPRYRWELRDRPLLDPGFLAAGRARGLSDRLLGVLAARGHADAHALIAFLDEPAAGLHDPRLLPDAEIFVARVRLAAERGERVLVLGDFDADGLTGLAIIVHALRRLGLAVEPYVPSRGDEGHGLSLAAVARAEALGCRLIVTVDCGSSSAAEAQAAAVAGIDVLITDHHQLPIQPPAVAALVNPQRVDSKYPERTLAGSGVAFKLAQLLLGDEALELVDLAAVGTVADVAPVVGENRSIVRLGLERLSRSPRAGLAALFERARLSPERLDLDRLAFAVAPRLNAVGRVGHGGPAAQLLLTDDPAEAAELADQLEAANVLRRELLAAALAEARQVAAEQSDAPVTIVRGGWPVGIIGLIAGRLADERGLPAVVFSTAAEPWRGSARSAGGFDLGAAFVALGDLLPRHGGHAAAAGCDLPAGSYDVFRQRLAGLAEGLVAAAPRLTLDLVLSAAEVDYGLLHELALFEPAGMGNPTPLVGIEGLQLVRARPASGGHTQLVLRKGREVLDGICFGRDDLAGVLREGDRLDLVARLASRTFGGFETLQLEVRDVGPAGSLGRLAGTQHLPPEPQPALVA